MSRCQTHHQPTRDPQDWKEKDVLNQNSLQAVAAAQLGEKFAVPLYDSYCFSQIPATIRYLFGMTTTSGLPYDTLGPLDGQYDIVILLFVDGFGWRFVAEHAERYPFLRHAFDQGVVSQLTSQFPSTTAAHVTTIHTGQPVGMSGVYEWFYYEPQLDRVIAPLLFSFAGDKTRGTLASAIEPAALYPTTTLYQELQQIGVRSYLYQHRDYASSPYSRVIASGARVIPFTSLAESLILLTNHVLDQGERAYYMLYFDSIDATSHRHGPESLHVAAEIDLFLTGLERFFHNRLAKLKRRALVLLTADHGHTAISPSTTCYINRELPQLLPMLTTNSAGTILAPAGSCRDMFLYVKDDHLASAQQMLRRHLNGRAEVWRVAELMQRGMFGAVSPALLERIGNLVVLPYEQESVWWLEHGRFEQHHHGAHGGLTRNELEIPFFALPYGA